MSRKNRTIFLYNWQLEEIDKRYGNRCQFFREAITEQLERDNNKLIPGKKVITISLEKETVKAVIKMCEEEKLISFSEYARTAATNKIENLDRIVKFTKRENRNPDKVYIPLGGDDYLTYKVLRKA
ncbi:hypothetical protein LCGC14_1850920 [marine sediment metagenome]|uniref:Uncharacterized protein n=1 Tax=marine sediment metagenome TaxID=412755 RepID=A0A0F9J9P6_9ZZZZ